MQESGNEWVMLPEACFAEFKCDPDPDANLPTPLRERHHLIKDIDESGCLRLAELACEHRDLDSFRQNVTDIRVLAPSLIEEYKLTITDYWQKRLGV